MITPPVPQLDRTASSAPPRPVPGSGLLLTVREDEFTFSALPERPSWNHDFRATLTARGLQIQRGLVSLLPPMIGEQRMWETSLPLDPGYANEQGESWACVEVEPDEDGLLTSKSRVACVHFSANSGADVPSYEPRLGRGAFALILWRGRVPLQVHQLWHFSPVYEREMETPKRALHRFK